MKSNPGAASQHPEPHRPSTPSSSGTGWENQPAPSPAVQRAVNSDRREVRNTVNAITGR